MIVIVAIDGVPIVCDRCDLDFPHNRGGRCDCGDHCVDCCPYLRQLAEVQQAADALVLVPPLVNHIDCDGPCCRPWTY